MVEVIRVVVVNMMFWVWNGIRWCLVWDGCVLNVCEFIVRVICFVWWMVLVSSGMM